MNDDKRPEWVPPDGGDAYTTKVMNGVKTTVRKKSAPVSRKRLGVDDYVDGVLSGDAVILGRAITLIESNAPAHIEVGQQVLQQLIDHRCDSLRVAITGIPGAGKSTLIEAAGMRLIESGHKLAVLAVDPSSSISGGSILGDKTRMESLSRDSRCFIRPSPSGGALGGVGRKTRETILLCEAAGYDTIFVETVGVGQNEVAVRSMVDFFLLVMIAGAGDELQGIKKGIMELADMIVINKADGDNIAAAERARGQFEIALHLLSPATQNWTPRVGVCSAVEGTGIDTILQTLSTYHAEMKKLGQFEKRRNRQNLSWLHEMTQMIVMRKFREQVGGSFPEVEKKVLSGEIPVTTGVQMLLREWESRGVTPSRD